MADYILNLPAEYADMFVIGFVTGALCTGVFGWLAYLAWKSFDDDDTFG